MKSFATGQFAARESIYAAAFNLFSNATINGSPIFITKSRRFQVWTEVDPTLQPALFQVQKDEDARVQERGQPTIWTMGMDLVVYASVGTDPNAIPSTLINNIIDALDLLMPNVPFGSAGVQTLGGLVYDVRISGKIETDEGTLGPQSVAFVPVVITTRS